MKLAIDRPSETRLHFMAIGCHGYSFTYFTSSILLTRSRGQGIKESFTSLKSETSPE
jgi:hypothetical protein